MSFIASARVVAPRSIARSYRRLELRAILRRGHRHWLLDLKVLRVVPVQLLHKRFFR